MTLTEKQCPTCDGTGFVARNDETLSLPNVLAGSGETTPYPARNDSDHSSALRVVRLAAYLVGAAAVFAALALLIKVLWH